MADAIDLWFVTPPQHSVPVMTAGKPCIDYGSMSEIGWEARLQFRVALDSIDSASQSAANTGQPQLYLQQHLKRWNLCIDFQEHLCEEEWWYISELFSIGSTGLTPLDYHYFVTPPWSSAAHCPNICKVLSVTQANLDVVSASIAKPDKVWRPGGNDPPGSYTRTSESGGSNRKDEGTGATSSTQYQSYTTGIGTTPIPKYGSRYYSYVAGVEHCGRRVLAPSSLSVIPAPGFRYVVPSEPTAGGLGGQVIEPTPGWSLFHPFVVPPEVYPGPIRSGKAEFAYHRWPRDNAASISALGDSMGSIPAHRLSSGALAAFFERHPERR